MSQNETNNGSEKEPIIPNELTGSADDQETTHEVKPGLGDRLRQFLEHGGPRSGAKADQKKDRTRSLALFIGGIIGAVLLFVGVFSTPTQTPMRELGGRATPNLGRPAPSSQSPPAQGSVTPLLNADIQSQEHYVDQLSPADIRGTSRHSSEDDRGDGLAEPNNVDLHARANPVSQETVDPLAAYRLNSAAGTTTYSYGGPPVRTGTESLQPNNNAGGVLTNDSRSLRTSVVKSSIVFVRASEVKDVTAARTVAASSLNETSLLPSGTRLAARLESAATTAVKIPVIASVEYNYERDGRIIVPAGAKVVGDVQQASSEGYISIRFHTLQMPNGHHEVIEATGVALDHTPLKGDVSGKNTGRKILSRTLSGVGTIAAYVVGAGGAGLGRTITGETLLRDRLASNIALAGEQELTNLAYTQNISVTVPANTRFYVVLQKSAVGTTVSTPPGIAQSVTKPEVPTVQELRELMDLKREINRMYEESNASFGRMNP